MDRDVAGAVFLRWEKGLPVYEGTLYKAAQVLGVDPQAALTEARFYTHLDRVLEAGGEFTPAEREYFSVASGFDPEQMEKTAEVYGFLAPDALIMRALRLRNFSPDLEKLAGFPPPPQDPAAGGDPSGGMDPSMAGGAAQGPQPGAEVQQNPTVRPTPTAPEQLDRSPDGNLQSLIAGAQQQPGAEENGGMPPSGDAGGGVETPDAATRLQSSVPGIPPDAVERYAPQLEALEQQVGMTIMDPKQIEKFVKEMQKTDKKVIDEAIKSFGEQQAQAAGHGSGPTGWDDTAPKPNSGGGGAPAPGGAPQQAAPQQPAPQPMQKAAAFGGLLLARRR